MSSLKVASLYLFLDYIFPQPGEATKAIRLFSFHLKSREPTSQSISCPALARLCHSSLLGFLGLPWYLQPRKAPFISKASWLICKHFAVMEGQEKPGLAIFCSAQEALCPALATLRQMHFLGRCFVEPNVPGAHLEPEQTPTAVPVTPHQLQWGLVPNPLGGNQNESYVWNCPGLTLAVPGFKLSHLLLGLLCPCTRRTAWNPDRGSVIHG